MPSSSKFSTLKGLSKSVLRHENHGTRRGVLNQIYDILHQREKEISMFGNDIYDIIDDYSDRLNDILDDLNYTNVEILFWYKYYMVENLDIIFKNVGQHFGLEDTLLILTSNSIV